MTNVTGTDQARVEEAWEAFGRDAIATEANQKQAEIDAFIAAGPGKLYQATYQIFMQLGVKLQKRSIGYVVEPSYPNFDRKQWSCPTIKISGIKYLHLVVDEERKHISRWRSETTGKFRIKLGDYGNRRSFPQRKDGSHNYEEIVRLIADQIEKDKAAALAKSTAELNRESTNILRNDLGLSEYGCLKLKPSSSEAGKVLVTLEVKASMDDHQIRKLVEALREVGVLSAYKAVPWRVIQHRARDNDEQWVHDGWVVVRGGESWSSYMDSSWEIGQVFYGDEEAKERAERHADDLNKTLVDPLKPVDDRVVSQNR